jgi:HAD superfamily hydrolase (TIGR01549 family)
MDSAVILDVDGVLLELTAAEEDAFFRAFEERYGLTGLSRDWDSYRIRNDQDIIDEILENHGLDRRERDAVIARYLAILETGIGTGRLTPMALPGARRLLDALAGHALGIATANLLAAARLRLEAEDLWQPVAGFAFGAEGGGTKRQTLARAVAATGLPRQRIVYVGDNLNDVAAGLGEAVHFIGFSTNGSRRQKLAAAGARHLAESHDHTLDLVRTLLT